MKALIEGIEVEMIDSPTVEVPGGPIYHVTLESGMIATGPNSWGEDDDHGTVVTAAGEVF